MATATVIEHRKFVFTRGKLNSNKVWEILLYDNDDVEVRYGRIGANMQSKTHAGLGQHEMEKLIKKKTKPSSHYDGGCYKEVKTLEGGEANITSAKSASVAELKTIATTQIATCPITKRLVTFFTEVNAHNIHQATGGRITYDTSAGTFRTPIGIVTGEGIDEARGVLDGIADAINKGRFGAKFDEKVEALLMLIPQAVPRVFVPKEFCGTTLDVQKQSDILDGLATSVQAVLATPKGKTKKKVAQPKLFDVKLTAIDDSAVISRIQKFYNKGKKRGHESARLKMKHVYAIDMPSMQKAWEADGATMKNVWRLWHGSKSSNFLSLLKHGYIIPPSTASHVCGRMFANGVYFSDQSTKSLNYAMNYWGGRDEGRYFMLHNQVAMGNYCVPSGSTSSRPPKEYDSYFAKAGESGVMNNEMVVFRTSQILPTYLIEFSNSPS